MSDLSIASIKDPGKIPKGLGGIGPVFREAVDTNFLEDVGYILGKPEEWLVNFLGRQFSESVKYRLASTNLYDQSNFAEVIRDTLEVGGPDDALGNILSAVGGLGASILNPLDPLNWVGLGAATKLGQMSKGAKLAKATESGIRRLPIRELLKRSHADLLKAGKSISKIKKVQQALKKKLTIQDQILEKLQRSGVAFDDILPKKTFFDRVRAGQQTVVGFEPFQNPILRSVFRVPRRDAFKRAAIQIRPADQVAATLLSPVVTGLSKVKEGAAKALNAMGFNIAVTEKTKHLAHALLEATNTMAGGTAENHRQALAEFASLAGFSAEEAPGKLRQVLDAVEIAEGDSRLHVVRALREVIDTEHDDLVRDVVDLAATEPDFAVTGSTLTKRQAQYVKPKAVSEAQAAKAIDALEDADARGGHFSETFGDSRVYVTDDSVAVRLPSDAALDPSELSEIAVEGVPGIATPRAVEGVASRRHAKLRASVARAEERLRDAEAAVAAEAKKSGASPTQVRVTQDLASLGPDFDVKSGLKGYRRPTFDALVRKGLLRIGSDGVGHLTEEGARLAKLANDVPTHAGAVEHATTALAAAGIDEGPSSFLVFPRLIDRPSRTWTQGHITNLEKIASMLAAKKLALLPDTKASDFIIGVDGSVQLVNPLVVRTVSKTKYALPPSRNALRSIAKSVGLSEDVRFSSLVSSRFQQSVRKVKPDHVLFNDRQAKATAIYGDGLPSTKQVGQLVRSLEVPDIRTMDDLADAEPALREQVRQAIDEISTTGQMAPIRFKVNDVEEPSIEDGIARLIAVRILAGDDAVVPAVQLDWIGEVAERNLRGQKDLPASYLGSGESIPNALLHAPRSYGKFGILDRLLAEEVRLFDDQGKIVTKGKEALAPLDEELGVVGDFLGMISRRTSARPEAKALGTAHYEAVEGQLGRLLGIDSRGPQTLRQAGLRLMKLLDSSSDAPDLISKLPFSPVFLSADDAIDFERSFVALQTRSRGALEQLQEGGILLRGSEDVGAELASGAHRAVLVRQGENLILRTQESTDDAYRLLQDYLRHEAPDLMPSVRVTIQGSDGTRSLTVAEVVGDIPRHKIPDPIDRSKFFVSDKRAAALRDQGIYVNPTIKGMKSFAEALASGESPRAFFVSMSGSLVVSTKHSNVDEMLAVVFGESQKHAREFGVVTKKGVRVSNVLGAGGIGKLTHDNLKVLERRMNLIARRLKGSGIGDDVPLVFETPFSHTIWPDLYPGRQTVGKVSSTDFRLQIPEELHGLNLDLSDKLGVVQAARRSSALTGRGPEATAMRKLTDYLEDSFDAIFVEQFNKGLPIKYREGYFARFLSPELSYLIDDSWNRYLHSQAPGATQALKYWKSRQLTGRTFTELRTSEINDLWQHAQDAPKSFIEFGKNSEHPFFNSLVAQDPDAFEFFLTDPIIALKMARDLKVKSIAQKDLFDKIVEVGSLKSGTAREIKRTREINKVIHDARADMLLAKDELDTARVAFEAEEITEKQLAKLQARYEGKVSNLAKALEDKDRFPFEISGDADLYNNVTITQAEARKLLSRDPGLESHITGDWRSPYMRIKLRDINEKLLEGTVVHLMDPEVMRFLDRHYSILHGGETGPLLKGWDAVTNLWKKLTLFAPPSFVPYSMRNAFSNFYLGYLGNVDMASYEPALRIITRIRSMSRNLEDRAAAMAALDKIVLQTDTGASITGREVWNEFVHRGGLTGGLHFSEFGDGTTIDLVRASVRAGFSPSSRLVGTNLALANKAVFGLGQSFSGAIENQFRLGAFIDSLVKGGSFEDAALNVKKLFYNYGELSAVERRVLRRVIPFYSWMRFNTPRMLETMATRPREHFRLSQAIARLQQGAGGPISEDELPGWLRNQLPINIERRDGRYFAILQDNTIPLADVIKFTRPGGFWDIAKQGLTPLLKVPAELAFDESLFTGRPLARAPGQPARSFTLSGLGLSRQAEHVIRQVRPVRQLIDLLDEVKGQVKGTGEKNLGFTLALLDAGIARVYAVDPARGVLWTNQHEKELRSIGKWAIREGARTGNQAYIRWGQNLLVGTALQKDGY